MKRFQQLIGSFIVCCFTYAAFAQDTVPVTTVSNTNDTSTQDDATSDQMKKLTKYVYNFGAYFGFDLENSPVADNEKPVNQLLNPVATQTAQIFLFNSVLGAIPVNMVSQTFASFIPPDSKAYSAINAFANFTFGDQSPNPYNQPADASSGKIGVNQLLDQVTFQNDPVSQAVLNILATPGNTQCLNYEGTAMRPDCEVLDSSTRIDNLVGTIPNIEQIFTYSYNQQIVPQLNSNVLNAPLVYSQTAEAAASTNKSTKGQGLTAQSQAQAAANFIRYAMGMEIDLDPPTRSDFEGLYAKATNLGGNVPILEQKAAWDTIAKYTAQLRVYAAQASVAYGNFYSILSKRMPQNPTGEPGAQPTSQAMSEFVMATRRIYNPDEAIDKQWLNKINTASESSVQKEIAILLAEINYQLYLGRQQEERNLMTNSVMLINAIKGGPSAPTLSTAEEAQPAS